MWKRNMFVRLMAEAGADGGAGGGDGAAAAAGADAAAQAGSDAAAQGADAPAAAATASALKQGEGADAAQPSIPEKYQVKREDGTLDIEASSSKLAEAYTHLEKRFGSGDLPPKDASEYKIEVPEAMGDYVPGDDPTMQSFLADAQKAGMTQAQMQVVMDHYFKAAPALAGAGATHSAEQATGELRKVWTTEGDLRRNSGLAFQATSAAIERAGVTMEDVERAGLGNNPVFIRLMAGLGAEFQEDKGVQGAAFKHLSQDDIRALEASEAYTDPKHADHKKVSEQIRTYYQRQHGTEAAG